ACTVMTLRTTTLSKSTPQAGAAGLTSLQVEPSCVNSQKSPMDLPAIPFSFMWTCFNPAESPAHADKSCRYLGLSLRGKCFGKWATSPVVNSSSKASANTVRRGAVGGGELDGPKSPMLSRNPS